MQPAIWKPPIELSTQEEQILGRIRRAKLFVFLRKLRHESFQQELVTLYRPSERGHPPIAPAQLALSAGQETNTEKSSRRCFALRFSDVARATR